MLLVNIITAPRMHPFPGDGRNTKGQLMTIDLGQAIPGLIVANAKRLKQRESVGENTVVVRHQRRHGRDVNDPDMYVSMRFTEGDLTEAQKAKVTSRLRKILDEWFEQSDYDMPSNFLCETFWDHSHGFASIGGQQFGW